MALNGAQVENSKLMMQETTRRKISLGVPRRSTSPDAVPTVLRDIRALRPVPVQLKKAA